MINSESGKYKLIKFLKERIIPDGKVLHRIDSTETNEWSGVLGPPNNRDLIYHLEGNCIYTTPLMDINNNTKASVIDLHVSRERKNLKEVNELADMLIRFASAYNISLIKEYTANKGFHLWLLVTHPTPARLMLQTLENICKLAQYEEKRLYPHLGDFGIINNIRLPFFRQLKKDKRASGFILKNTIWLSEGYPKLDEQVNVIENIEINLLSSITDFLKEVDTPFN